MRKLMTFLLCIISASSFGQIVFVNENNTNRPGRSFSNTRICLDCKPEIPDPLFILDGKISKLDTLKKISDLEIDSVWILKREKATSLFGSAGANGVIIVSSKPSIQMQVLDLLDHSPLPNTSVMFVSADHRDTAMFMADSNGWVRARRLKHYTAYSVTYTAAGYKPYQERITLSVGTAKREILMERNYVSGENVVVSATSENIIRCFFGGRQSNRLTKCEMEYKPVPGFNMPVVKTGKPGAVVVSTLSQSPRFFPNPLLKGQSLHVEMSAAESGSVNFHLVSTSGAFISLKQIEFTEGMNRIELPVFSKLTSGMYVIMIYDANEKLIAQQKIIIQ